MRASIKRYYHASNRRRGKNRPPRPQKYSLLMRESRAYEITVADEADIDGIIDVVASVAAEERYIGTELPIDGIVATIERPDTLYLNARSGERIIGHLGLYSTWPGLLGLGMAVVKDWRSQGVGEALLIDAIEWARQSSAHKISLEVFSHNTAAIAPYEKHGFVREGLLHRHIRRKNGEYGTQYRWVSSSSHRLRSRRPKSNVYTRRTRRGTIPSTYKTIYDGH
jgi:ribosomal-protein-alanine N-acetyltransferase